MVEDTQKFLEVEEGASKLVRTLQQLHTEATSYQTATKELDTVRQRLMSLIEATQDLANDSYEAVKVLRKIGGPEILQRLAQVEEKVTQESASQSKKLSRLRALITLTFAGTVVAVIVGVVALVI